jgi:ATPase subunit of ABC transporter with duplicated ATPase domains
MYNVDLVKLLGVGGGDRGERHWGEDSPRRAFCVFHGKSRYCYYVCMEIENANQDYRIDTSSLYKKFQEHLDLTGNDKIFFSGKYGTGKTTFLKEFFFEKKNSYDVYHLFPINYQIKSNDDAIDLLRYDLLVEF